jgi:calcium-dependent protein kinase
VVFAANVRKSGAKPPSDSVKTLLSRKSSKEELKGRKAPSPACDRTSSPFGAVPVRSSSTMELQDMLDSLGSGEEIADGMEVAVKVIQRNRRKSQKKAQKADFINEVSIMRTLAFSNRVAKYVGSLVDKRFFCIGIDLCHGGDVLSYILKLRDMTITEFDVSVCIKNILLAIKDVHSANIAHLDLKPENILLATPDDPSSIKLIDFGSSKLTHDEEGKPIKYTEFGGTIAFAAPEVSSQYACVEGDMLKAVDMWAIGVISFQLLTGCHPFYQKVNTSIAAVRENIFKARFAFPEVPRYSPSVKDFVSRLICRAPADRMTVQQALNHNWIVNPGAFAYTEQFDPSVLAGLQSYRTQTQLLKLVANLLAKLPLTDSQMEEVTESFRKFDVNDDGFIEIEELARFLREKMGVSEESAEVEAKHMFEEYDANSDGMISLDEFIEITFRGSLQTSRDAVAKAFKILDLNKDGSISYEELVRALGDDINESELKELIAEVDRNADGTISFEEFLAACEQLSSS